MTHGRRKSLQAATWKAVFATMDGTCSSLDSRAPPTMSSSSSRAASVTCTASSMMQATTSRRSTAAGSLKIFIAMIAKSFSFKKQSPVNALQAKERRNSGGSVSGCERRTESVRNCEEKSEEVCREVLVLLYTREHTCTRS
ncbi:unnamed protein product [Sphagnum troendelagicum]